MTSAVADLVAILDLEPIEVNLFRGRSPQQGWQRVFGGQVIGQALVAACRTVEDLAERPPHSLHAYFLLGGDPKVPIVYEVDRIRDGKSFTTRRVVAIQHGHAIFSMSVSFQVREPGFTHQAKMPDVPGPDELPSDADLRDRVLPMMPESVRRYYERERPIELRPVEFDRYLGKKYPDGRFHVWIRTTAPLPDGRRDPPLRARLCVRLHAARCRAHSARPHRVREDDHGREPRPCAVVSPAVPRRRMAALRPGQPECIGRTRLLPRPHLHAATGFSSPRSPRKGWCASATKASRRHRRA